VLHDERFWDAAPASMYAALLDEGSYLCYLCYLCWISTMYRLLRQQGRPATGAATPPTPPGSSPGQAQVKPELVADAPNQCWSWDITKLAGPAKWTWSHL
jgi:putative transposase